MRALNRGGHARVEIVRRADRRTDMYPGWRYGGDFLDGKFRHGLRHTSVVVTADETRAGYQGAATMATLVTC